MPLCTKGSNERARCHPAASEAWRRRPSVRSGAMRLFDAGLRRDRPVVVHDRVWTVANAITFVRLAGLPLFVWLLLGARRPGLALLVLAVVATTDWVDGYVARRFDQVTRLGRVMDPLIDRALLATAGVTLAVAGILPWWIVALIVVRDVLLVAVGLVLFGGIPAIPVSRAGKFATACLLAGVPSYLIAVLDWAGAPLFAVLAWVFTLTGLAAYYVAGAQYGIAARVVLRAQRQSAAVASRDPAPRSPRT